MAKHACRAVVLSSCLLFVFCDSSTSPTQSSGAARIDSLHIAQSAGRTGAFSVLALDYNANEPLSDVSIAVPGNKVFRTDSSGIATLQDIAVGEHTAHITKKGYESMYVTVALTVDSNSGNAAVVKQGSGVYYLNKQGATVSGTVFYDNESIRKPAVKATVELRLSHTSLTRRYCAPVRQAATTASGRYEFRDIPEYAQFSIRVLPFSAGDHRYTHHAATLYDAPPVGDTVHAQSVILEKAIQGDIIALSNNFDKIKTGDTARIAFSAAVDTAEVKPNDIILSHQSFRILPSIRWSSDLKSLSILPFGESWSVNGSYALSLMLSSVSGASFHKQYSFRVSTNERIAPIGGLRFEPGNHGSIDYSTTSGVLRWNDPGNVSSYSIYQKTKSDPFWKLIGVATDTFDQVSTQQLLNNGKSVKFLVVGENASKSSPLDTSTALEIKDTTGPKLYFEGAVGGTDNTSGSGPKIVRAPVQLRSETGYSYKGAEPLDTSKSPSITIKEASPSSSYYGDTAYVINEFAWKWTASNAGELEVVVDAGKNGGYDSVMIDFRSLSDLAGNAVDAADGSGLIKMMTR